MQNAEMTKDQPHYALHHSDFVIPSSFVIRASTFFRTFHTRTGTLAVRSSLPQLTQAPFTARRIAFQMQ